MTYEQAHKAYKSCTVLWVDAEIAKDKEASAMLAGLVEHYRKKSNEIKQRLAEKAINTGEGL